MKLVQDCLSARNGGKSRFHHSGGRAGLFKCQERSKKPFSPLWRSCEAS